MAPVPAPLLCPACLSLVVPSDDLSQCAACGLAAAVRGGVVCFKGADNLAYVEVVDFLDADDLARLCAAFNRGDAAAGRAFVQRCYPRFYKYLFEEGRADWRFFVPLGPEARVLDIGSGWGGLAIELAREVGHVQCMDASLSKLEFTIARARAEGISNVSAVNHDFTQGMPFPDSSFDLAVLNGVLEWAGAFRDDAPPEVCQLRLLREARRVLRPGGHLYVGIENRCGYWYAFGREDEHAFTPFTTLLPRRLADIVTRVVRRRPYRTYTYGASGLRQLLHRAGFGAALFAYSAPNYRRFRFLIELDDPRPLAHYYRALERELPTLTPRTLLRALLKDRSLVLLTLFAPLARLFVRFAGARAFMRNLVPSFSVIASR